MVYVEKLTKAYQKKIVINKLSFKINHGDICGICGNNGAGKTTLILVLATVILPDAGEILIDNINIKKVKKIRNLIGYVPQQSALYENLSGIDNLKFFATLRGLKGAEKNRAIEKALNISRAEDFCKKKIINCSGGMKQRINFAVGILGTPKLLLLDEPTSAIDENSYSFIEEGLKQLNKEGATIIIVNHNLNQLDKLCNKKIILEKLETE